MSHTQSHQSVPRPASGRRRVALGGIAALAVVGLAPSAAHAATAQTLDAVAPVDMAASGDTLAWLRPESPNVDAKVQLVVRDGAGATPRVVAQALPARTNDLTIGTDAAGKPTAIVATRSSSATHNPKSTLKGALYALPLDGSAAPKRLAVAKPGSDTVAPGLFRGILTFARSERAKGQQVWTVRIGKLDGARSTVVTREARGVSVPQTAPGADGQVAYITFGPANTRLGGFLDLRLKRQGAGGKRLSHTGFAAGDAGFGPLTVTADGRRLTASRWATDGRAHDFTGWSLPGGKRLDTEKTLNIDVAVPVGSEGFAVHGATKGLVLAPAVR